MKNRFLALVVMIAGCVMLPAMMRAQTTHINENFDALATGVPNKWNNQGGSTPTSAQRWRSNENGFGGTRGMRFDSDINAAGNDNILRTLSFTAGGQLEVSFKFKNPAGGVCLLQVLDNTTKDTVTVDTLGIHADWTEKNYLLSQFNGKTIRLLFHSFSNQGGPGAYHYLDDVMVRDMPSCATPQNFVIEQVGSSSATISWGLSFENIADTTSKYRLSLARRGDFAVESDIYSANMVHRISGLQPATEYVLKMSKDCSSKYLGESSWSENFVFSTLSPARTLPFEENFDAASALPAGWVSNAGTAAAPSQSVRYGSTGRSLRISASASEVLYVVTPQLVHAANDLQVSMMLYGAKGMKFSWAVVENPYDPQTFTPFYTDSLSATDQWEEFRFSTAAYPDIQPGRSVALLVSPAAGRSLYVDEFSVGPTPLCPRPERLRVTDFGSDEATLEWQQPGSPSSYQAELRVGTDVSLIPISAPPATLTALAPQTLYRFRVRGICGSDTSEWSLPVEVKTKCGVMENPIFTLDFENPDDLGCWTTTARHTSQRSFAWDLYSGGFFHGDSVSGASGTSLRKEDSNEGSTSWFISQPIRIDQAYKYVASFWMRRDKSTFALYENEGVRMMVNTRPDTVGAIAGEMIPSNANLYPEEPETGWYRYQMPIPLQGDIYLIFEGVSQNGRSFFIDDIEVGLAPACMEVSRLDGSLSAPDQYMAVWEAVPSQSQWIVRYRLTDGTTVTSDTVVVSRPGLLLAGLRKGADFSLDIAVAALCAPGDTSVWTERRSMLFTTPCDPVSQLPVTESFEGGRFLPQCWSQAGTVGKNPWTQSSVGHSGSYSAMVDNGKSTRTLLISPLIDFPAEGDYTVSFFLKRFDNYYNTARYSGEGVALWINSSPDTAGGRRMVFAPAHIDFAPAQEVAGWARFEVEVPASCRGMQYVILEARSESGNKIYVDDIAIRRRKDCRVISGASVGKVLAGSIEVLVGDTSVTSASQWRAEYGAPGFIPGSGTPVSPDNDSVAVIRNLDERTVYEIHVQRLCGAEESDWEFVANVETPCAAHIVTASSPFLEDFQSYAVRDHVGECYSTIAPSSPYTHRVNMDFAFLMPYDDGAGEPKSALINSLSDTWIFRSVQLRAGVTYEMSAMFGLDNMNASYRTEDANANLVLLPAPDLALLSDSDYLAKEVPMSPGWSKVSGYFTPREDGVFYAGWQIVMSGFSYRGGLDNLVVRELSCAPPTNVALKSASEFSAEIEFTATSDSVEVIVCQAMFDPEAVSPADVVFRDTLAASGEENLLPLSGLADNTLYYYAFRGVCADAALTDWTRPASFRTRCNAVPVPYVEGFEDATLESFNCVTLNSAGNAFLSNRETMPKKSGNYSYRLKQGEMILPKLAVDSLAGYQLDFWVYAYDDSTLINVSTYVDPDDNATMETAADILVPQKNVWQEVSVGFSHLDNPDSEVENLALSKYIAITVSDASTYLLDDIRVAARPACPRPTDPSYPAVTTTSVTIGWRANAGETSWRVRVYQDVAASGSQADRLVADTIVASNPCTITGLAPSSVYRAEVAAVCAGSDVSAFTACGSFGTACDVVTAFPFYEGFDGGTFPPLCWSQAQTVGDNGSQVSPTDYGDKAWVRNSDPAYVNNASAGSAQLRDMSDGIHTALYLPRMRFEEGRAYMLSYYHYRNDVVIPHEGVRVWVNSVPDTLGGTMLLYSRSGKQFEPAADKKGFMYYEAPIPSNISGDQYIIFEGISGFGSSTYIDDILVEEVNGCYKPSQVTVGGITGGSAAADIVDGDMGHTRWEWVCVPRGGDINAAMPTPASSKHFPITGLSGSAYYQLAVRTVCDDGSVSNWATTVFKTGCGVTAAPFAESFEEYARETLPLSCIDFISPSGENPASTFVTPYVTVSADNGYFSQGAKSLSFVLSDRHDIYAVLPPFEQPIENLVLSFDYRNEGADEERDAGITVGRISDIDNPASFHAVASIPLSGVMTSARVSFISAAEPGARIAIRLSRCYDRRRASIDNIRVDAVAGCGAAEPRLLGFSVSEASFDLAASSDSVEVAWGAAGLSPDDCTLLRRARGGFSISALAAGTAYTLYCRPLCPEDNEAPWTRVDFHTACNAVDISAAPYVETFDAMSLALLPQCFEPVADYTDQGGTRLSPTVAAVDPSDPAASDRALLLKNLAAVALPPFVQPNNTLVISYKPVARTATTIAVGLQSDLGDPADFEQVAYRLYAVGQSARDTIDLSFARGDARYIVVKTLLSSANIILDSLVVEPAAGCYGARNLRVDEVGDTSAVARFNLAPDATWMQYRLASGGDSALYEAAARGGAVSLPLSGLTPDTGYSIAIRSACASDTSDWTPAVRFRTIITPASVPYLCGFEDEDENARWAFADARGIEGGMNTHFAIGSDSAAVCSGEKALYVSNDSAGSFGYNTGSSTVYAYRSISLDAGTYAVSCDWKCYTAGGYARLFIARGADDFAVGSTDWERLTPVSDDRLDGSPQWQRLLSLVDIADKGIYCLVAAWHNDAAAAGQEPAAFDNFAVEEVSCRPITAVKVSPGATGAVVSFANPGGITSVDVRVNQNAGDHTATAAADTIDAVEGRTVFSIGGLEPETDYCIHMLASCGGDGHAPLWVVLPFSTTCRPDTVATEWREDFEAYLDSNSESASIGCWSNIRESGAEWTLSTRVETSSSYTLRPHTGQGYVRYHYNSATRLERVLYLQGARTYELSAWVLSSLDPLPLEIFVEHNGERTTLLSASFDNTEYERIAVRFTTTDAGDYTIGFRGASGGAGWHLCLDDISLLRLKTHLPSDIAARNVTQTSATITWTGNDAVTSAYHLRLSRMGRVELDTAVASPAGSIGLDNLLPGTRYGVEVRAVDTEMDTSEWVSASFRTACGAVTTVPVFEDFDDLGAAGGILPCWERRPAQTSSPALSRWNWGWLLEEDRSCIAANPAMLSDTISLLTPYFAIPDEGYLVSFDYLNTNAQTPLAVYLRSGSGAAVPLFTPEVSDGWQSFTAPLAAYAGQTVRLEFSAVGNSSNRNARVGLDNFRIDCLGDEEVVEGETCPGADFVTEGFDTISASQIAEGDSLYIFRRLMPAREGETCSYYKTLRLRVRPGGDENRYITLCPGQTYSEWPFTGGIDLSTGLTTFSATIPAHGDTCASTVRVFVTVADLTRDLDVAICEGSSYLFFGETLTEPCRRSHTYRAPGSECDSTVNLTLRVVSRYYDEADTICEGSSIVWQDTTLTTTGLYEKVFESRAGCDSIRRMRLTVVPAMATYDSTICYGQSVLFGDLNCGETGSYTTFARSSACPDAQMTLNLTVVSADTVRIDDSACEGDPYTGYGLNEVVLSGDTSFLLERRDPEDGCVSYQLVNIHYKPTVRTDSTVVIPEEGFVTVGGNTYTEPGTVTVREGNPVDCWTEVTYHIVSATAVGIVAERGLAILPNPAAAGSLLRIETGLASAAIQGATVEVVNAVGQVVSARTVGDAHTEAALTEKAPDVPGVYTARITLRSGETLVGRIVVR